MALIFKDTQNITLALTPFALSCVSGPGVLLRGDEVSPVIVKWD